MVAQPLAKDEIVPIEKHREKAIGASGRMLLPSPKTVAKVVAKIPRRQLATIDLIRKNLAQQFKVDATCPFNTKLCLRAISNDPAAKLAYWRVIRDNGDLIKYFPGGIAGHAKLLKQEGFSVEKKGEMAKVKDFRTSLVSLN